MKTPEIGLNCVIIFLQISLKTLFSIWENTFINEILKIKWTHIKGIDINRYKGNVIRSTIFGTTYGTIKIYKVLWIS